MTSANLTWLQVLHFRFESAAFIYAQTGSYRSLFVLGCTALALGALLVACSRLARSETV